MTPGARLSAGRAAVCATVDGRFLAWAAASTIAALLTFGLVSAIIPNPVFARRIPPEPFAIAVWIVSAPLMGLVAATYVAPPRPAGAAAPLATTPLSGEDDQRAGALGTVAGVGAFLAIGCPVCNKLALVLLGTSGALGIWAPIQPVVGLVSLALLVGTLAWRLRIRARGGACRAPG